jgi:glycerol kinase
MAFQTLDVVDAIVNASGTRPAEMRVDGGASAMDLLCQFQSDLLGVPVRRAACQETTALGAAYLAGIAEGVWDSPADAAASWTAEAAFEPAMDSDDRDRRVAAWNRALERSRDWENAN